MTQSVSFRFLARLMMPVLVLFSLFLLLRGHNQPGGGFIGGLVGASSIILMTLAYGSDEVRQRLRIDFLRWLFYGLSVALIAGLIGMVFGTAFQHAVWWSTFIRGIGRIEFSTPLLFDIGVYIVVFSATSAIVMSLAEEGEREDR
jgi:multicomponent Na+:H+ antiporter subunit B